MLEIGFIAELITLWLFIISEETVREQVTDTIRLISYSISDFLVEEFFTFVPWRETVL